MQEWQLPAGVTVKKAVSAVALPRFRFSVKGLLSVVGSLIYLLPSSVIVGAFEPEGEYVTP
jgi:hypothetical protein